MINNKFLTLFFFVFCLILLVIDNNNQFLFITNKFSLELKSYIYYFFLGIGILLTSLSLAKEIKNYLSQVEKRKLAYKKNLKLQETLNKSKELLEKVDSAPFYSIENIEISNFKGIKDISITIPPGTPWVYFTGENGFGKTSILQGIASSLDGYNDLVLKSFKKGTNLTCKLSGEKKTYGIYKPNKSLLNRRHEIDSRFKYIYCYGSSRLDTYSESSSQEELKMSSMSLYRSQTLLNNIEHQLTRWYFKKNDPEFKTKYEIISKLFIELLNLEKIEIDKKNDTVLYFEKDRHDLAYGGVDILKLASSYRNIISMIGDLVLRVYKTQFEVTNPKYFKGIVIIDEFELHLHPKFQMKLPSLLSQIFPQIQFIVCTHSPIPILGAIKGSVFFKVSRNHEKGVYVERLTKLEKEIKYLQPNSILSSDIFDFNLLEHLDQNEFDNSFLEDNYNDIEKNKQINERLNLLNKDIFPDDLFKNEN